MNQQLRAGEKQRIAVCLFLTLLLGAVVSPLAMAKKVYIEPTAEVEQCADQCNVVKMQCRSHARDRYQYCKAVYQQQVRQFNWCRQNGGNCLKPDRCPIMQTKGCTNNYDLCFESCGGIIEDSKELKKRQKAEARAAAKAAKDAERAAASGKLLTPDDPDDP